MEQLKEQLRQRLAFLKPEILLLVPFLATLPLYSPSLALFHDLLCTSEDLMSNAMYSLMVGAIVIAALVVLACARRKGEFFVKLPVVIAGSACYVGGYVLLALVFKVEALALTPLAVAAGLLLAAGSVALSVAVGVYMAAYDMRQSLTVVAIVVGISAAVRLLVSNVPTVPGLVLLAPLTLAAVALPCWKAAVGALSDERIPASEPDPIIEEVATEPRDDSQPFTRARFLQSVKRMAQVAGVPFIGFLVFAFVMGVRKMYVLDVVYIEMLSDLIAAVVLLPFAIAPIKRPLLPFLYQQALPVFVLVLIVLNSFPESTTPLWWAGMASYVLYSMLAILALASISAMAHAREFSPALLFSTTIAFFAALSLAGIQAGTTALFEEQDGGPTLLVISTVFFAFMLLMPLLQLGKRAEVETEEPPAKENELLARCNRVAEEGGLSPRETEVLTYLGRGHGVAFVASSLVVSESTVRTHVKNIYRKLGVSSREELLQLIDQEPTKE